MRQLDKLSIKCKTAKDIRRPIRPILLKKMRVYGCHSESRCIGKESQLFRYRLLCCCDWDKKRLMKKKLLITLFVCVLAAVIQSGCRFSHSRAESGGVETTFEHSTQRQMDRLNEDYARGRITPREYEARKKRIRDGQLVY